MTNSIIDKVSRLVNFATGETYGDGYIVTDVIVGYAEPGYGDNESVIVLGDWNPRYVPGAGIETSRDRWTSTNPEVTLPVRLARSLERVGADIQWCDEWTSCQGCFKAVRTEQDSYSWKPSYAWNADELLCHNCLIEAGIDGLTEYVNEPTKCITWCEPSHVESLGFIKWEPGNEHTYESGWHPGQTDDPAAIYGAITETYEREGESAPSVIFFLDESSQFYIRFSAYVRAGDTGDDA